MPPLVNPDESLASPQSLFRVSPNSPFHPVELHLRGEYFPLSAGFAPGNPSGANKYPALAAGANKVTKRKPVLLLVEDNEINLKVCLDHKRVLKLLPLVIPSIRTDVEKAS